MGSRLVPPKEDAECDDCQRQRLLVRAGIACHWQAWMNRDAISYDERTDLDLCTSMPACSV